LNLYNTKKGYTYIVERINGGRQFSNKMDSMGILPGKEIQRVNTSVTGGPVVIQVGNAQYALGRGMASKIQVEKIDNE
jgi:ferrous iron transport protein A